MEKDEIEAFFLKGEYSKIKESNFNFMSKKNYLQKKKEEASREHSKNKKESSLFF